MAKDYDNAISNLKSAIALDFKGNSDQQDMLKTELAKCTNLEKEKEKIRIEKLQRFRVKAILTIILEKFDSKLLEFFNLFIDFSLLFLNLLSSCLLDKFSGSHLGDRDRWIVKIIQPIILQIIIDVK